MPRVLVLLLLFCLGGLAAKAQPNARLSPEEQRYVDWWQTSLRNAEALRRAGRCQERAAIIDGLQEWWARPGAPPTGHSIYDPLIRDLRAMPCPIDETEGDPLPSSPFYGDASYVQIERGRRRLQQAQVRCDPVEFDRIKSELMLAIAAMYDRETDARRREWLADQSGRLADMRPPQCADGGADETMGTVAGADEEAPVGGGTVEQPDLPPPPQETMLRAAYLRLESARRECSLEAFEAARRQLIDALGRELRRTGLSQTREVELIRERERVRGLQLDRCDNLEAPPVWRERPPQEQEEPRDDVGMDPPVPPVGQPPLPGPPGPMFPDHTPPVM